VEQAETAGLWVQEHIIAAYGLSGFGRYYVSPYVRTLETAGNLGLPNAAWRQNWTLRERSWGELETLSREEHRTKYPDNYAWMQLDRVNWTPPGGNSIADISDGRVREFFGTLHRDQDDKKIDSVVAVTHGELMEGAGIQLEYMSSSEWRDSRRKPERKIHNCQVVHYTRLDPETGERASYLRWVRSVNAGNGEQGPGIWRELGRKIMSNESVLEMVERVPRLWVPGEAPTT
jgi:broad specificity phosphatase PhoE